MSGGPDPKVKTHPLRPSKKQRRRDAATAGIAKAWHDRTVAFGCRVCPALGQECEGDVMAHHVLRQQHIRRHVDTVTHEEGLTGRERHDLEASLLWDLRNGLGVCYRAHRRHHSGHQPIPRRLLPWKALTFAGELDLLRRIEDEYPDD